ncbi:GmrSD restriction endonuclease domain-containing protein [Caldibacillus debilis]|uniref:GmrSD restriction endonuclease domain-containing protein n=1 Tax=Caldibacillus debilis TaxID=301148 RepID=UPI000E3AD0AA|nr:DUF262 domain-containing protein [Caldibacillus debilis]REJ29252.1 MAG: AAA family ATPase [Caldibacillus debilis]
MHKESTSSIQRELSIRSESIQRIYNFYKNNLFFVNRRYQRKLIWTIEEKKKFIDSIIKGYPIPLILLAETKIEDKIVFEIIDGMQRLNAITSFIEGEFDYDGYYFDLETMVESKSALDEQILTQKEPRLSRKYCEIFASYVLPLSVYSFTDERKIDEIFIRINSYGKHLSRQELRSAGTLGIFNELVRQISSKIRTDATHGDILSLNKMKEISITNTGLDYGISVEEIFWVKHNVLTKEMVREARDEELVADILAAIALPEIPPTSSDILDEYYGLKESERSQELEQALKRVGTERLMEQFIRTYDEIRNILNISGMNFRELIFKDRTQRLPRYFQIIFLAIHKLLFKENKEIYSYSELVNKLDGIANHINITEGGNWSAANRIDNINAVVGIIQSCFKEKNSNDPATTKWLTEFESLLMQSKTEQALFDFKQGFTLLDGTNSFDFNSFSKIILTLTAMANNSPNTVGYICVGVCNNKKDMERVEAIYGVKPIHYREFYITGIGHEIIHLNKDLDSFYRWIIQEIKKQPISVECKDIICRNIRIIDYYDKDVLIFKIHSSKDPMIYNGKYYRRHGANVEEVPPEEYPDFFRRFT